MLIDSLKTAASGSSRPAPLAGRVLSSALLCLLIVPGIPARAQTASPAGSPLPDAPVAQASTQDEASLSSVPRNLLEDQAAIWTSPARVRARDLEWLAPLALATGAAIATDHRAARDVISNDRDFNQASVNVSNALIGGWLAAPVALAGIGHFRQNVHAYRAGVLSGEAMIDSAVVVQGIKFISLRERPAVDSSRGRFFQSSVGMDSSFPSMHSAIAWSAASALAGESPSHWSQFALYSAATGVSLTRAMGREHFPSDVLVGSATGWLIGHYVVHRHHRRH